MAIPFQIANPCAGKKSPGRGSPFAHLAERLVAPTLDAAILRPRRGNVHRQGRPPVHAWEGPGLILHMYINDRRPTTKPAAAAAAVSSRLLRLYLPARCVPKTLRFRKVEISESGDVEEEDGAGPQHITVGIGDVVRVMPWFCIEVHISAFRRQIDGSVSSHPRCFVYPSAV